MWPRKNPVSNFYYRSELYERISKAENFEVVNPSTICRPCVLKQASTQHRISQFRYLKRHLRYSNWWNLAGLLLWSTTMGSRLLQIGKLSYLGKELNQIKYVSCHEITVIGRIRMGDMLGVGPLENPSLAAKKNIRVRQKNAQSWMKKPKTNGKWIPAKQNKSAQ